MQRPSYEPFDPQQNMHNPPPYGTPAGGGGGGYSHGQYNQQHFAPQNAQPTFGSRFEMEQSGERELRLLQSLKNAP